MEKESVYIGFKNNIFREGEKVEIMDGVDLYAEPIECKVIKEYPKHILLDVVTKRSFHDRNQELRHRMIGVNKGSMLCGDVLIRRLSDGAVLTGDRIGIRGKR